MTTAPPGEPDFCSMSGTGPLTRTWHCRRDGYLYIQYDRNRAEDGEILFARITEKDIISGTIASGRSALRKIVSRPRGNQP